MPCTFAVAATILESFIQAQKVSVRRALRRGFRKYLADPSDFFALLLVELQKMVRERVVFHICCPINYVRISSISWVVVYIVPCDDQVEESAYRGTRALTEISAAWIRSRTFFHRALFTLNHVSIGMKQPWGVYALPRLTKTITWRFTPRGASTSPLGASQLGIPLGDGACYGT